MNNNNNNIDDIFQARFSLLQSMSNDDLCALAEITDFPSTGLSNISKKRYIYGQESLLDRIIAEFAKGSISLETDKPRIR